MINLPNRDIHQLRIDSFMRQAGQSVPEHPVMLDEKTRLLRARLILEEAFETIEKGLGINIKSPPAGIGAGDKPLVIQFDKLTLECVRPMDMIEFVDGCADVSVVTVGSLTAAGIAAEPLFAEVDEANLRKFGPGGRRREDGKWIKPPDWTPPNIAGVLERQGWTDSAAESDIPAAPAAAMPAGEEQVANRATSLAVESAPRGSSIQGL